MIPHNLLFASSATISGNLLDIPTRRHAQDDAHCLPANFHIKSGLYGRRHQKESIKAQKLTAKALGERSRREYARVSIGRYQFLGFTIAHALVTVRQIN
jgi:hypothetical protein